MLNSTQLRICKRPWLLTDMRRRLACAWLQEAAGVFDYLHANVPLRLDFVGLLDLAPDATSAAAAVCLAQVLSFSNSAVVCIRLGQTPPPPFLLSGSCGAMRNALA